mmetsp:Transcript_8380/g.17973  ORF Transcript_8380/g.17973 Transcript_8380/m.17973 type:complete len:217 (+) Transcript_8380:969-1619(+)
MVTGEMRRMVVTLSRKAERMAVTRHSSSSSFFLLPPLSLQATTPVHSKTPVRVVTPTMIIMPQSRARVPWSIHPTVLARLGTRCCAASTVSVSAAPSIAAMHRCSTSVTMRPKTKVRMKPAITTWYGPVGPSECRDTATGRASPDDVPSTKSWCDGSASSSNSIITGSSPSAVATHSAIFSGGSSACAVRLSRLGLPLPWPSKPRCSQPLSGMLKR